MDRWDFGAAQVMSLGLVAIVVLLPGVIKHFYRLANVLAFALIDDGGKDTKAPW